MGKKCHSLIQTLAPATIVPSVMPRTIYLINEPPRTSPKQLQHQKESYERHAEERRAKALKRWRDKRGANGK